MKERAKTDTHSIRSAGYLRLLFLFFPAMFLLSCDPGKVRSLKAEELKQMVDGGAEILLVDTRSVYEYQMGTISGSVNLPQEKFGTIEQFLPADKSAFIVLFCRGYG